MDIFDDVKEVVRQRVLRTESTSPLGEVKDDAESWWDRLPGKRKDKVRDHLGLSKGASTKAFSRFSKSVQAEIEAYFIKYKGKVEGIDFDADVVESKGIGKGAYVQDKNWKGLETAVKRYNGSVSDLEKALGRLALTGIGPGKGSYAADAIRSVRSQMGKKIDW